MGGHSSFGQAIPHLLVLAAPVVRGAGCVVSAAVGHHHHISVATAFRGALRAGVLLAPPAHSTGYAHRVFRCATSDAAW